MPAAARISRSSVAVAVVVALVVLAGVSPAALAATTITTTGKTGVWSVADSASAASLTCSYESGDLSRLTVAPPTIYAKAKRNRFVGWQVNVYRAKWWAKVTDQWYLAYSSPIAKAKATRKKSAVMTPLAWDVPAAFRTNYDSLKVQLVLYWYGSVKTKVVGRTTIELEFYGESGAAGAGVISTNTGHCPGSKNEPQPPPSDPIAPVPEGFVKMSHWQPYWRSFNVEKTQAVIDQLTAMHQTGIILTGIETGNKYSLPAGVATYLQMFRDAGIKPYLALWIGKFSDAEKATTVRAWQDGNGLWAGIILDVEGGLLATVAKGRQAAVAAVDKYMATVRPLTPFLAFSTMAIPTDYPDMLYSELNSYSDAFMPQLYFSNKTDTALYRLDQLQASLEYEAARWAQPAKPVIPVVNDWGANADTGRLHDYVEIALSRYGAVSGWRLHPDMSQGTKDMWGTFAP
jgi:hypothetical protein